MTLEEFILLMKKIQISRDKINEISIAFEADIFEVIFEKITTPEGILIDIICSEEEVDIFNWWLYEDGREVFVEGKKIELNTYAELYEFLKTVN